VNSSELLDLVVRLASTLPTDFSVRDVLDRVAEELGAIFPVVGVGVLLLDPDGPDAERHLIASAREEVRLIEGLPIELDDGPCLSAARSCEPVVISEPASAAAAPVFTAVSRDAGVRTVLSLPIRRDAERFGALEVYATSEMDAVVTDLESWQMLADVVASYVSIAHQREGELTSVEELQQAAFHDPLTGLPNRRLLDDRLHQARERTRRMGAAYGVLFCDLDGFKPVNDRFGHHVGDQLLVELAHRLEEVVRPHDTVARVSGDEFVILCEDLEGPRPAVDVAERVLATVETPFPVEGTSSGIRVGISIGIAVAAPGGPESSDEIVARADAAMYRAKQCGGWRAAIAGASTGTDQDPAHFGPSYIAAS
jgi:diguanylate cyclase (GGDEF)-like protein